MLQLPLMEPKITRHVEHDLDENISSPMAPPESSHHGTITKVPPEELAPCLKILWDEHRGFLDVLDGFEKALGNFKNENWQISPETSKAFGRFFEFMDHDTPRHNGREEKSLFPVLHEKLIAAGECSPGEHPTTAIDIMEDDHLKVAQATAIIFNLLGISGRLRDGASRAVLCQIAHDQGREVVEVMRLHILKENEVLLPHAQQLCSPAELHAIGLKMARFGSPHADCSCDGTK